MVKGRKSRSRRSTVTLAFERLSPTGVVTRRRGDNRQPYQCERTLLLLLWMLNHPAMKRPERTRTLGVVGDGGEKFPLIRFDASVHSGVTMIRTGPSRPEDSRGEFFLNFVTLVFVSRSAGGNAESPMRRLGQRFITSTSSLFPVGLTASVISTLHGAVHTTPRSLPLRRMWATFLTRLRSRSKRPIVPCTVLGRSNVL